ncbi:MAG: Ppx/GppA family phosphatase [Alphaproteobacteria bacterium]|nr:Ppx/GppA family phosphatase [Alphaproteobacteria bacterium]
MRVAIIDIGSNAIRAAIYSDNTLGAFEIFNEKFRSDISFLLDQECITTRHSTYNKFAYFLNIFKKMNVSIVACVATEILRVNPKAQDFAKEIKDRFGIEVHIVTGEEEARLTATGLISTSTNLTGIVVDLGGGSLELAEIANGQILKARSIPLGARSMDTEQQTFDYIGSYLKNECGFKERKNLYLIGGALRLLGRYYMDYSNTIIKNLHNLVIPTEKFNNFLTELLDSNKLNRFIKQNKVNSNGVVIVRSLINFLKPKNLIISTYGLKEGVRFTLLPGSEKIRDIIIDKCVNIAGDHIQQLDIESYIKLFNSIIQNINEEEMRLLRAAIILSQTTVHIEQSHKPDWLVNFLLTVDIPFNQVQRATLIVALGGVFASKSNLPPNKSVWKLLDKSQTSFAQMIGAFIKIAITLDGPMLSSPCFSISEKNHFLEIEVKDIIPKNIFDKIYEHLKILGIARKIWMSLK